VLLLSLLLLFLLFFRCCIFLNFCSLYCNRVWGNRNLIFLFIFV
jgi:hypothetical protein